MTAPGAPVATLALPRYQRVLREVSVRVCGAPRRFLLDLGAGVTLFDPVLVADLGLLAAGSRTGQRMTGEDVRFELFAGVELSLGGVVLPHERIGAFDIGALLPPDWPRVDGVLALDALEHVPFTLDLVDDVLVLESPASLAERVAHAAALSVRAYRQIPDTSLVVLVAVSAPDGELWFELDNSNAGPVVLSPATAGRLGVDGARADCVDLDVVGLGSVTTPAVVKDVLYDGNLGTSVLDGRVLTFDVANERVWVSRDR